MNKANNGPAEDMIFAGIDDKYSTDQECAFDFYYPLGDDALFMPAITSDADTIKKVKSMTLGQIFNITSEGDYGPIGTRVNSMEVTDDVVEWDIGANRPATFAL